ncbi:MAG: hypothetical protein Q4B94_01745 [Pseudomonadota bacterium]|nr:hypothetical protein [Pseudomonadota bacterium]
MSRVLAVVFEEDDLRDLRQIWHAFDAISTLASHPMEANLRTIGALADIAGRQLGQLLAGKPLGSGWEPYLDDIPDDIPRDDTDMDEWLAAMDTPPAHA